MTAEIQIMLPLIDFDDTNDFSDEIFDPLPLDAQNDCDADLLCDLRMMEDVLRTTPLKSMKCPRRVSFEDRPIEISVPSFACLGEMERRSLWYRSVEIDNFRTVARHACRTLRKNPMAFPADITRGLELRTSQDRQYRKHLALNCILKAQLRFPKIDPLHLASIADRCTALPRQEAVAQGSRDFCDVYCPIPMMPASPSFLPFTVMPSLKRGPSVVSCEENQQQEPEQKRRRFISPQEDELDIFELNILSESM